MCHEDLHCKAKELNFSSLLFTACDSAQEQMDFSTLQHLTMLCKALLIQVHPYPSRKVDGLAGASTEAWQLYSTNGSDDSEPQDLSRTSFRSPRSTPESPQGELIKGRFVNQHSCRKQDF